MRIALIAVVVSALLPAAAGAQPSAPVVTKTDVIYGRVEGSALLANIAYPDGPSLKPAIISVHGGRWRAGNRADASSIKVTQWAEFGFFAMSIDYRLVGSPAPAPYLDMLTAIRWLHAHADEYPIDPERVYLIGQSAGGQMVSLFATAGEAGFPRRRVGEGTDDVRAVISVAATYELNTLVVGQLVDAGGGNVEDARRLASPINHVSAKTKPLLVIHSDDDKSVPVQQANDMEQAQGQRRATRYVHYTDKGHMGITDDVIKEARAFIAEVEQKK